MSTDLQTNLLCIPHRSLLCKSAVIFSPSLPFVLTYRGQLLVKNTSIKWAEGTLTQFWLMLYLNIQFFCDVGILFSVLGFWYSAFVNVEIQSMRRRAASLSLAAVILMLQLTLHWEFVAAFSNFSWKLFIKRWCTHLSRVRFSAMKPPRGESDKERHFLAFNVCFYSLFHF